ncbi:hypothetical protein D1AOALGA4SA_5258 [Olavius algarvensis Delta 1 endosymbiont]|nr:hypothetical protein D1AOALGA4SA_5258 [Olavius algarvensis Delta 1 endosymbiont]
MSLLSYYWRFWIDRGCGGLIIEWTHKRKNSHYISMIR